MVDFDAYQEEVLRTCAPIADVERMSKLWNTLHASIGLAGEAGEIADAVKRAAFYGCELDVVNIREEIGDVMWYIALLCRETGVSFEDAVERNVAKLKVRYPDKFCAEACVNRNLEAELAVLKGKATEDGLPIIGKEYGYLGQPVEVTQVVPCEGGSIDDAYVEFRTRLGLYGDCRAGYLTKR